VQPIEMPYLLWGESCRLNLDTFFALVLPALSNSEPQNKVLLRCKSRDYCLILLRCHNDHNMEERIWMLQI